MSFTQQGNHSAFPDRELQRAVYSPGMGILKDLEGPRWLSAGRFR